MSIIDRILGRTPPEGPQIHAPGKTAPPPGAPDQPAGPEEEVVPMSPFRARIAERLKEAQNVAALLTTFNEIDMSGVIAVREELREALGRHGGCGGQHVSPPRARRASGCGIR